MQFPYHVSVPKLHSQWWPRYQWMRSQLGARGSRWTHRDNCFWFKDEGDLVLYLLRWG
jgi:hypothetical protein